MRMCCSTFTFTFKYTIVLFPSQIEIERKTKKIVPKKCSQDLQNYPILTLFSYERTLTNPGISVKIFSPQLSLAAGKTKATSQKSLVSYIL